MDETIDLLGRQDYVDAIKSIISKAHDSDENVTLCLDGPWGSGKSFIINLLEKNATDWIIFKYDAWEKDFYDEPLIGILSVIIEKLNVLQNDKNAFASLSKKVIKDFINKFTKVFDSLICSKIGIKPFKICKSIKKYLDDAIKSGEIDTSFNSSSKIEDAKKIVNCLITDLSKRTKVLFIVDEIDRCEQEYALRVLERIHHITSPKGKLQTLVSVDCEKISNFISNKYSNKNEDISVNYLNKFFDIKLFVNNGNLNTDINKRFDEYNSNFKNLFKYNDNDFVSFEKDLFSDINIRIVNKIYEKANLIHNILAENEIMDYSVKCMELILCAASLKYSAKSNMFGIFSYPLNPAINPNSMFKPNFLINNLHQNRYIIQEAFPSPFIMVKDLWSFLWYQIVACSYSRSGTHLELESRCKPSYDEITKIHQYIEKFAQYALTIFR